MTPPPKTPIDEICDEIERAMNSGFYYLALSVTLSLPNICAALPFDPPSANSQKYKDWIRDNVLRTVSNPYLTADEIFGFRCGVLHNGLFQHPELNNLRAFQFLLPSPGTKGAVIRTTDANGEAVLMIDLAEFCEKIMQSAKAWLEANKNDPNVATNINSVIRYRDTNCLFPVLQLGTRVLG